MSPNLVQVNWEARKKVLFSNLSILRKKEIHTDITLSCDGESYAAHRLVLTMGSGYFARTFENNKGASPSLVLICGIRSCILKSLLNFIYDGTTTIKGEDIADLSKAGILLEVPGLMELGKEYTSLSESMDKEYKSLRRSTKPPDLTCNSGVSPQSSPVKNVNSHIPTSSPPDIIVDDDDVLEVEPVAENKKSESATRPNTMGETASSSLSAESLFESDSCDSENFVSFEGWEKAKNEKLKVRFAEKRSTKGKRKSQRCPMCNKSFFKLKSLREHIRSYHAEGPYTCTFCGKGFKNERSCKSHLIVHINEKENVKDVPENPKGPEKVKQSSRNIEAVEKENVSKISGVSGSIQTKERENGLDSLRTSTKTKLDPSSEQKLRKRRRSEESFEEYTIDDVLKSVSQSFQSLSRSEDYLLNDDSMYDEGVSDDIGSESSNPLQNGVKESNSIHKLKETLNLKRSVSSVNTRACRYCNAEFLNSKRFRQHRISDCKVLECPFCLASFETRLEYNNHITIHDGVDRPYICPECTYYTDVKRSFEDHMSLHTGIYRFWCLLCDFQARKLHELKTHTTQEHPEVNLNALDRLLSK